METDDPRRGPSIGVLTRLIVLAALTLVLGYLGYVAITLGHDADQLRLTDFIDGERRILQPADLRDAPLRIGDTVYLLTTQTERIIPLRIGIGRRLGVPREMLHVDLWAIDAATATPRWQKRLRTFGDRGTLMYEILGADGDTLWLFVREPIAVAAADGTVLADGARLEAVNAPLAGKRVDQTGYVAFGGQGLQLTLSDATQWVVRAGDFRAERRETAPKRDGLVVPANAHATTSRFQLRGIVFAPRWLGILTDKEAEALRSDPVVPGAEPGERRGAAYDFYARFHVPDRLTPQPQPYRLWSAKVAKVSAAPPDWPKELPDNWGTRDEYSDYRPLPDAPPFLQAGLLGDDRSEEVFWYRDPDSVLVLHHDKVGNAGRLRLARVAGPNGRVVWDAALGLAEIRASFYAPDRVIVIGTEPNPDYVPSSEVSREHREKMVTVAVADGAVATFDLTSESVRPR